MADESQNPQAAAQPNTETQTGASQSKLPSTQAREAAAPEASTGSGAGDFQGTDGSGTDKRRTHDDRRWDRLTRELAESRRKNQEWEQKFAEFEKRLPPAPDPEFKTAGELIEHVADQRAEAKLAEFQKRQAEQAAEAQRNAKFQERFTELSKTKPEAQRTIQEAFSYASPELGQEVAEIARESQVGPQLLLHLAENPDLMAEIDSMSPKLRMGELLFLERQLREGARKPQASQEEGVAEPKVEIPKPISKTKGGHSAKAKSLDELASETSVTEYIKRKREMAKKR